MRSSDWSSDVCSSDLIARLTIDLHFTTVNRYFLNLIAGFVQTNAQKPGNYNQKCHRAGQASLNKRQNCLSLFILMNVTNGGSIMVGLPSSPLFHMPTRRALLKVGGAFGLLGLVAPRSAIAQVRGLQYVFGSATLGSSGYVIIEAIATIVNRHT